jgi:hypothetical protein
VIFTLFPSDSVSTGTRIPATWDLLAQVICHDPPAAREVPKKALALWCPASFKGDHRAREDVEAAFALGFDVDIAPVPTEADLRAAMAGQACLFHLSSSATPTAPRWRLLLQLSRPATGAEYDALWAVAARSLPFPVGAAKDPSRGWYMPRVPEEGDFVGVVLAGEPLDVDWVLSAVPANVEPSRAPVAPSAPVTAPAEVRRLAAAKLLASAWPAVGTRHDAKIALAGGLWRDGMPQDHAVAFLRAIYADVPSSDGGKIEREVRDTYQSAASGKNVTGWKTLSTLMDAGIVSAARDLLKSDATIEARVRLAPDDAPSEGEPSGPVIVIGTDLPRVIDQGADALSGAGALYQRGGELIRIVRVADTEATARDVEGTPTIRTVPPSTLKAILTSVAQWERQKEVKTKGGAPEWKTVATTPSDDVVAALLQRGEWSRVRPLTGIVEAPTMRPDGSILQAPGYDAPTAYIFEPGGTLYPEVPDRPTHDDARRALYEIADVFADFPFASDAARATPIAAVLTVVGRPAIEGNVPAFGIDAPTRGTGKTLAADAVGMIATGRRLSKITFPASAEELEKILAGYARRGASLFSWDNVTVPFGGGPLDKVLTCGDTIDLRILGRSEVPTFRWRAVQLFTGNGIELCGDTARRVLVCRLESPLEDPENRADFKHPDLLKYIGENRPQLVVSALTMLRAYVVAGRPAVGVRPWGSFEQWSALVASAVAWSGGTDPQGARPADDATAEPEKADLASLLIAWPASANGLTAGELLTHADDGLRHVVTRVVPLDERGDRSRRFGRILARWRGRVVGGRRLASTADQHAKVMHWRVEGV